jgi:hypothetical protein
MALLRALAITALLLPFAGFAQTLSPCQSLDDFECLVRNSSAVYQENYEHWWKIYHRGFDKAWACRSYEDVATFLHLWSAEGIDGETAEGRAEDTEKLLSSKPTCFFEGVLRMREDARALLMRRYCQIPAPEPVLRILRESQNDERYGTYAAQLLRRVQSEKCEY